MSNQNKTTRISDDQLREMIEVAQYYVDRAQRARQRETEGRSPDGAWFFGIVGLKMSPESFDLLSDEESEEGWILTLRQVEEPPLFNDLLNTFSSYDDFAAVGRYSPGVTHELVARIGGDTDEKAEDQNAQLEPILNFANSVMCLLRIRALADVLIPAACDHSWATIAGHDDRSCKALMLEDFPTHDQCLATTLQ